MKRFTAFILLITMLLGVLSLSSCKDTAAPTKPANVFKETPIELPEELKGDNLNFNNFSKAGDVLYILACSYDEETYMPSYFVAQYDLASGTFGETVSVPMGEQTEEGGSNLSCFTASPDGTLHFAIEYYSFSEELGYTQRYEIMSVRDGVTVNNEVTLPEDAEMGFYINSMEALDDGVLVLASWNGIRTLTPEGAVNAVEIPDPDNTNVEKLFRLDGKLYASVYNYGENSYGSKLYAVDVENSTLGEELEIKNNQIYNMVFGPGYDYYYNDYSSVWGCSFDSSEMTEVVNFINSDINGNDIRNLVPISTDRFFIVTRSRSSSGRSSMALSFIDRVPEDQVVEKKMLRMAVSYASYSLRTAVIDFNKASDTYRITIDDYSRFNTDENYSAGIEKLNSDIITGNVPDIFMITTEMPYGVYAARGLFADLYELMDADTDFARDDYLENVFEAFEYDGKLITVAPYVSINTFAAQREFGDSLKGWDLNDFMEFSEAHPDMRMFDYDYNRASFVQMFMMFCRDKFIDGTTGICDFDNDEFRTLLEIAKTIPEQSIWETDESSSPEFWKEYEARFKEDNVLLAQSYISDLNYSYKNLLNYTLGGEPVFVGFPSGEGNGAVFSVYEEYAISDDSDFKEGAWQFIKTILEPESQMPFYNEEYDYWEYPTAGIPLYKPAVEKMAEIAMMPPKQTDTVIGGVAVPYATVPTVEVATEVAVAAVAPDDVADAFVEESTETTFDESEVEDVTDEPESEDKIIADDGTESIDGVWSDPYAIPLTESQIADLLDVVYNTTRVARYDNDLDDIINEELEPYFQGAQSLDDTVKHIQNRVSIYINESR